MLTDFSTIHVSLFSAVTYLVDRVPHSGVRRPVSRRSRPSVACGSCCPVRFPLLSHTCFCNIQYNEKGAVVDDYIFLNPFPPGSMCHPNPTDP